MNQRTSRLLQKYSTQSKQPLAQLKREWHDTPTKQRGKVRAQIVAALWGGKVRAWQKRHSLIRKEAAEVLGVAFETYRDWCDGDGEPNKLAKEMVEWRMAEYSKAHAPQTP